MATKPSAAEGGAAELTAGQALAALASVRGYRERLTGRAAGQVWMVWGFALAILATGDMVGMVEGAQAEGPLPLLVPLSGLAAGAFATNAIWRSHALELGLRHRGWVAWAGIAGLLAAGVGIGFVAIQLAAQLSDPAQGGSAWPVVMPLVAAVGAAMIAGLQRRRVSPIPGLLAAAALVGLEFLIPRLVEGPIELQILGALQWTMLGILACYFAVGAWHLRQG